MSGRDNIYVVITENATNKTRLYVYEDYSEGDDSLISYMWDEGNYACDCNRSLFFSRAAGEEEDGDGLCGSDAYSVNGIFKDGKLIYTDDMG